MLNLRNRRESAAFYDGRYAHGYMDDWRAGIKRIASAQCHPCVLLASRVADENMRQEVIRHHGYDVLPRSADRDQVVQAIQFAWFWITRPNRFAGERP